MLEAKIFCFSIISIHDASYEEEFSIDIRILLKETLKHKVKDRMLHSFRLISKNRLLFYLQQYLYSQHILHHQGVKLQFLRQWEHCIYACHYY